MFRGSAERCEKRKLISAKSFIVPRWEVDSLCDIDLVIMRSPLNFPRNEHRLVGYRIYFNVAVDENFHVCAGGSVACRGSLCCDLLAMVLAKDFATNTYVPWQ